MKKFFKYLIRTILAILMLLILVIFLLYLPPVQRFLKTKAVNYVAAHTGMVVKVGDFRLGFPLDLTLQDVYVGATATDTLAAVQSLHLKVGLGQILRKQLRVDNFELKGARLGLENDTTGMRLRVAVDDISLLARNVDLATKQVEIDQLLLNDGQIVLATADTVTVPDTTASKPLDWTFLVDRIELNRVNYRMTTPTLPLLGAGVEQGRITGGKVALAEQTIDVQALDISGAWCNLQTADADTLPQPQPVAADTLSSQPWTVRAATLQLDNSAFSMLSGEEKKMDILLSGIAIQLDSIYNRGTVVRAALRDLKAVQKDGITLTSMQAHVALDSTETSLQGAYIRITNSWIKLDAHSDTDLQHLMERVPLTVSLNAEIGLADITPFYPDLPREIRNNKVNINSSLSITDKRLQVGQLIMNMPGHFKITGSGSLASYLDMKRMRGSFILRGELPDITFAQSYLGKAGVHIPRNMDMLARLKAERGNLQALLRLCCGEGCLTADGGYRLNRESYDAELTLNRFPLDRFLPADSLGNVSADIRLSGQAFSWEKAKADINAHIQHFDYRRHDYQNISLTATVNETKVQGKIVSEDPAIPLNLTISGDSIQQAYTATLAGKIGEVNLEALHFVPEPLTISTDIDLTATLAANETYTLTAVMDTLLMSDARTRYALGNLKLDMKSDREKTTLDLLSGDLTMNFQTDTSLMGFVGNISEVGEVIRKQVEERNVNMELVREDLPPFSLQLNAAQGNAISRFLKSRNIGFKKLMVDVVSRRRSGIRLGLMANAPYFGTVRLDSVQLGAWQTGKSLMYSFAAGSSSEEWKGLFNINVTGRMQGDRFRVELKQKDAEGKVGFDLGINLILGDSTYIVSFFPMNPILAYSRWIVNADNRVVISKDGRINANLRMAYMNKLVSIQSLENQGEMHDRLQVEFNGIDLAALSRMVPFMPQLSGILNTDLKLYSIRKDMGVDGNIQVVELGYEQQRIGTVDLGLQYIAGNRFTDHTIDFELKIDSIRRALVKGTFSTSETKRDIAVDAEIPSFPLYILNAFVPADVMKLNGELTGNMHFRGTIDRPLLNGELAFHDGQADLVMLGTIFRLDPTPISIADGKIMFRKYRFIAPNNSDLVLNGDIALTPFDQMNMDLSVDANNFEVVNVKKNETSLIYGKAYADIHSRIAGAFSALNVTGNINLLNSTNITYTLRSSDPSLVDKSVDLVRFVSFRDSTLNEKDDLTNRVNTSSFALRMMVEIGDQVTVGVDLSEDGNNHVTIQGGGNLVLTMNPESGMVLSGKYILSGGTVVYNVPIAGKKEFSIQSGSYVEWTGNVANPMLNITASEAVKATVEDGDRNRLVTFESIIRIQNNLNRPDITFDLSAPNDMVIQNQLATFSQEERTRQALNLLIYNTYTAPGAAKSATGSNVANNAIYSFVENELNKYTRKAGITIGVDSYNTDENTTRTDYTYEFSRQLFNDRVRVKIGGRISTDNNEGQSSNLQDNLVDDISIEYVLTKKRNLFVKVFRHSNYESVLDGEVTQTGVGIVWRKNFRWFRDLFKSKKKKEREVKERGENKTVDDTSKSNR